MALFGGLANKIIPLKEMLIAKHKEGERNHKGNWHLEDDNKIKRNFLYYFKKFNFVIEEAAK